MDYPYALMIFPCLPFSILEYPGKIFGGRGASSMKRHKNEHFHHSRFKQSTEDIILQELLADSSSCEKSAGVVDSVIMCSKKTNKNLSIYIIILLYV